MRAETSRALFRCLSMGLLMIGSVSLKAQTFVDIMDFSYRLSPSNSYVDSSDSDIDIQKFNASVFLPLEIDTGTYLLVGGGYAETEFDELDLYSASMRLGLKSALSDDWGYTFVFIPKVNSDGGAWDDANLQLGAFGLLSKKQSEDFSWKLGAYVNQDRFSWLGVPIIGLVWQVDPSLKLDLSLPIAGTLRKTVSEKFMYGMTFTGRKFSYNLGEGQQYLEVSDTNIWTFADLYLSKNIVLNLRAGHSFLRDYGLYADGDEIDFSIGSVNFGDDRMDSPIALDQGLSFHAGLLWRVHVD